jgi:signal transduction histidine kinase
MKTDEDARLTRLLRATLWGGAAFAFLVPVVAKLTLNIPWTAFDFIFWAVMLLVAAGVCEIALRLSGRLAYRAGMIVAVGTSFLIIWSNLAVGIIGDENNPLNQIFFGVIALAVVGAVLARFRPKGMAIAMAVTAAAQFGTGFNALADEQIVFGIVTVFALGWLLAAGLFREAARAEVEAAKA